MHARKTYRPKSFICTFLGCTKSCHTRGGLKRHARIHRTQVDLAPVPDVEDYLDHDAPELENDHCDSETRPNSPGADNQRKRVRYHPFINGNCDCQESLFYVLTSTKSGRPCDAWGHDYPAGMPPLPRRNLPQDDWQPFKSRPDFELSDFLYRKEQMTAGNIDELIAIMAALYNDDDPSFHSHRDLYKTIDSVIHGDAPWQSFAVKYSAPLPEDPPNWMTAEYDVWHRDPQVLLENQLSNRDFDGGIDYAPKIVTDEHGQREVGDLMSGQWAWNQCVCISILYVHVQLCSRYHPGKNQRRSSNSWCNVCAHCSGKRQNHRLRWHRSDRVLPSLHLTG